MTSSTIFVVEDDAIIALRYDELLTKMGYEVPGIFASGEELLDCLGRSALPDLILMDIGLSGNMDGIETARRVRERYKIPVIFISSYSDEARRARARDIPAQGYIVKPVVECQLVELIGTVINQAVTDGLCY